MPALNVGLQAESTGVVGWKLFDHPGTTFNENATISIDYGFTPSVSLATSGPNCSGSDVAGDGNVTLLATPKDVNSHNVDESNNNAANVTVTAYAAGSTSDIFATNGSGTVESSFELSGQMNKAATLELKQADLEKADSTWGAAGEVSITWTATAQMQGEPGLPSSATQKCTFLFNSGVPGQPSVDNGACGSGDTFTVGQAATLDVTANASSKATTPDSYSYQLNGGDPITVTIASGTAAPYEEPITFTPTRVDNTLTVTATAAGGGIGQPSTCPITALAPTTAEDDQDLTDDQVPDLVTVGTGTASGTASGLWLASGQESNGQFNGSVSGNPTDIAPFGPQGAGAENSPPVPGSWNGLKVITGLFQGPPGLVTGSGFTAIEAWNPANGAVYTIPTEGDGSSSTNVAAFTSQAEGYADVLDDTNDTSGNENHPQQLVNAYHVSASAGISEPFPDVIGEFNDPSTSVGSYLAFFEANDGPGGWDSGDSGAPYELTNTTPDGSMDWNDWTITSSQATSSDAPASSPTCSCGTSPTASCGSGRSPSWETRCPAPPHSTAPRTPPPRWTTTRRSSCPRPGTRAHRSPPCRELTSTAALA